MDEVDVECPECGSLEVMYAGAFLECEECGTVFSADE